VPLQTHDEIAARIRACRAYAGLTRKELGEKVGTSSSTVERWEKGHAGSLGGDDRSRGRTILWDVAKACGLDPAWAISDWELPPSYSVKESEMLSIQTRLRRIEEAVGVEGVPSAEDVGISIADLMEMVGSASFSWAGASNSPALQRFGRLLDLLEGDPEQLERFRRIIAGVPLTGPPAGERPEDVVDDIQRRATAPDVDKETASGSPEEDDSRDTGRSRSGR
jgi:transcriptional regulator with XRE-family HTH domain